MSNQWNEIPQSKGEGQPEQQESAQIHRAVLEADPALENEHPEAAGSSWHEYSDNLHRLIKEVSPRYSYFDEARDFPLLLEACKLADDLHVSTANRPIIEMAIQKRLEAPTIIAAILAPAFEQQDSRSDAVERCLATFGPEVGKNILQIAEGYINASRLDEELDIRFQLDTSAIPENLARDAMEAIADAAENDASSVALFLVARLAELKACIGNNRDLDDCARQLALKSREIYAQLAAPLYMSEVVTDFEDTAFSILMPAEYEDLRMQREKVARDHGQYIRDGIKLLNEKLGPLLDELGIEYSLSGRLKGLWSAYAKIQYYLSNEELNRSKRSMESPTYEGLYDHMGFRLVFNPGDTTDPEILKKRLAYLLQDASALNLDTDTREIIRQKINDIEDAHLSENENRQLANVLGLDTLDIQPDQLLGHVKKAQKTATNPDEQDLLRRKRWELELQTSEGQEKFIAYLLRDLLKENWDTIHDRERDYADKPTPTGYRAVHVTLAHFLGSKVEFQLRSKRVHMAAEYGDPRQLHTSYKAKKLEGGVDLLDTDEAEDEEINFPHVAKRVHSKLLDINDDLYDSPQTCLFFKDDLSGSLEMVRVPREDGQTAETVAGVLEYRLGASILGMPGIKVIVDGVPQEGLEHELQTGDMLAWHSDQALVEVQTMRRVHLLPVAA